MLPVLWLKHLVKLTANIFIQFVFVKGRDLLAAIMRVGTLM